MRHGTKSVTVDLERRTCDCRVWDLVGIPCSHAVAAIHDRRDQPLDYVSHFYSKETYLKAYVTSIPALKGMEYWEMHDYELLLPPDMPKTLRGRPKRLRRREAWEGGNQNKTQVHKEPEVPGVQRYSAGRIIHCSYCGVAGHKRPTCSKRVAEETAAKNGAQAGNERGHEGGNEGTNEGGHEGGNEDTIEGGTEGTGEGAQQPRRPATKANKAKLPIRKAQPGIVIRESAQVNESCRERMLFMPTPGFAVHPDNAIPGFTPTADTPPRPPATAAPLSKEPENITADANIDDESKEIDDVETEDEADESLETAESESDEEVQPRRSDRLWRKTKFKFKNTPDTAISLDDDEA